MRTRVTFAFARSPASPAASCFPSASPFAKASAVCGGFSGLRAPLPLGLVSAFASSFPNGSSSLCGGKRAGPSLARMPT